MTTVLTTHYLDEAERLCDRIAIVHEGRIVALDEPGALLADLGDEIVELRVDRDPAGALAALRSRGIADDTSFAVGATLTVPIHGHTAGDAVAAIAGMGIQPATLTTRRPSLDDVYLQLTGSRLAA
jgi:ABC-type multidrug transport system ATPase subunit